MAGRPFLGSGSASVRDQEWQCGPVPASPGARALPAGWCRAALGPLPLRASFGDAFLDSATGARARLDRVRTPTLAWLRELDPADPKAPANAAGFVVDTNDLAGLETSGPSLAGWRVLAFHSWTKSRHTVAAVQAAGPRAGGNSTARLLFGEDAVSPYGQYTYCSKRRFVVEGAPGLLARGSTLGDFLALPADPLAPGDAWCNETACDVVVREGLARGTGALRLPLPATLLHLGAARAADLRPQPRRFRDRPWARAIADGLDRFARLGRAEGAGGREGSGAPGFAVQGLHLEGTRLECVEGSDCGGDIGSSVRTAALQVRSADGLRVSGVSVRSAGGWGMRIDGCHGATVSEVAMEDVGAGGLGFAGSSSLLQNVQVRGFGRVVPQGPGVALDGRNVTVADCEMTGGWYNGFVASQAGGASEGSSLRRSFIHSNGRADDSGICDFGALHAGGAGAALPLIIEDNEFANITAFANGGNGIYLDVSATGFALRRNLVHGTLGPPLYWHVNPGVPMNAEASPLEVSNNFFVANGAPNAYALASGDGAALNWCGYTAANMTRNIVVVASRPGRVTPLLFTGRPCAMEENASAIGPHCTDRLADNFWPAAAASNLYWNATGPLTPTFPNGGDLASWQSVPGAFGGGRESGSAVADPLFVDLDAGNFTLRPESPALAMGIRQLFPVRPGWRR